MGDLLLSLFQGITAAQRPVGLDVMEELHAACDKLFTELDHLERLIDRDEFDEPTLALALAVAKRVRVSSTVVIKALAQERDKLQA